MIIKKINSDDVVVVNKETGKETLNCGLCRFNGQCNVDDGYCAPMSAYIKAQLHRAVDETRKGGW